MGVLLALVVLEIRAGSSNIRNQVLYTVLAYMGIVLGQYLLRMNIYGRNNLKGLFVNTVYPFVITYSYLYKEPLWPVRLICLAPIMYWLVMGPWLVRSLPGSREKKDSKEWKRKVMRSEEVKMMSSVCLIVLYLIIPLVGNL